MALLSIITLIGLGIYALIQLLNSRKVKAWPIAVTLVMWLLLSLFAVSSLYLNDRGLIDNARFFNWTRNVSMHISSSQSDKSSCEKMLLLEQLEGKHLEP